MANKNQQKYYRVQPNGKAPSGLNVGDQVVTGGGTYRIEAVHPNGTYASSLADKNLTTANFRGSYSTPGQRENPVKGMKALADSWAAAAIKQKQAKTDAQTAEQIAALQDAEADAQTQFQTQRDEADAAAARALDNAALHAEARGDRGGIGQGQYQEIQAAALKNQQAIRLAQSKLASDTAREITALRARGEFEKADALLDVTQKHLSELLSLEKWGADWEDKQTQQRRSLEQWERSFELSRANVTGVLPDGTPTAAAQRQQQTAQRQKLAASGNALLKVGVMPSDEQLAAMGMSAAQAQSYIRSLVSHGKL